MYQSISTTGLLCYTETKEDVVYPISPVQIMVMNDILHQRFDLLTQVYNFLDNLSTENRGQGYMETVFTYKDKKGKIRLGAPIHGEFEGPKATKLNTLIFNLSNVYKTTLVRMSMFAGVDSLPLEKIFCREFFKAIKPLVKIIPSIPNDSSIIGFGFSKLVFKSKGKVYKYFFNQMLLDAEELMLEPLVLHVLDGYDVAPKYLESNKNLLVQEFIEGSTLQEVLSLKSLTDSTLDALAGLFVQGLLVMAQKGLYPVDITVLNYVADSKNNRLVCIDLDAFYKPHVRPTMKSFIEELDSNESTHKGKEFNEKVLKYFNEMGLYLYYNGEKYTEPNSKDDQLLLSSELMSMHPNIPEHCLIKF